MSEKLGAIAYGSESDEIFLGRSMAQARTYSEEVAAQIDQEVKNIIEQAHAHAQQQARRQGEKLAGEGDAHPRNSRPKRLWCGSSSS